MPPHKQPKALSHLCYSSFSACLAKSIAAVTSDDKLDSLRAFFSSLPAQVLEDLYSWVPPLASALVTHGAEEDDSAIVRKYCTFLWRALRLILQPRLREVGQLDFCVDLAKFTNFAFLNARGSDDEEDESEDHEPDLVLATDEDVHENSDLMRLGDEFASFASSASDALRTFSPGLFLTGRPVSDVCSPHKMSLCWTNPRVIIALVQHSPSLTVLNVDGYVQMSDLVVDYICGLTSENAGRALFQLREITLPKKSFVTEEGFRTLLENLPLLERIVHPGKMGQALAAGIRPRFDPPLLRLTHFCQQESMRSGAVADLDDWMEQTVSIMEESYSEVVSTLRATFASGRTRPMAWRRTQLQRLLKMYEENEELLCQALASDLHKPRQEAICLEIEVNKNTIRGCLLFMDEWAKDEHVEKNLLTLLDSTFVRREPLGVVLVIGAWNYPLQLSLGMVAGAIAAGNCVVVKPSEVAPNAAKVMAELVHKYLDTDCFRVICGGVPETTELLKVKFDYIFFTGSSTVGKVVSEAANRHLTPCTLELGGKCPVYIDSSANLEVAAKRIIWGKMINVGQTCVAPDYVICSEEVKDKFVKTAKRIYADFYAGKGIDSTDICRIINDRNFERLHKLVADTRGKVVLGGVDSMDAKQKFIGLTIVTDVDKEDSVMKEELFGPILPVVSAKDAHAAAAFIRSMGEKPLSLYIFSSRKSVHEVLLNETSSGSVCVNDVIVHLSVETLPFGGVGASGYGRYHGKYTFDTFSHSKAVLVRDLGLFGEKLGESRYPPYSNTKINWLNFLVKTRRGAYIPFWMPALFWMAVGVAFVAVAKAFSRKYNYEMPSWL